MDCMDMSSCDWLLRWSGWNVQTDRQFVWTCPIVTGYRDGAVGMYRQTVRMDMYNCDWLLRWSGWNVQTDSLYGHVQL